MSAHTTLTHYCILYLTPSQSPSQHHSRTISSLYMHITLNTLHYIQYISYYILHSPAWYLAYLHLVCNFIRHDVWQTLLQLLQLINTIIEEPFNLLVFALENKCIALTKIVIDPKIINTLILINKKTQNSVDIARTKMYIAVYKHINATTIQYM